MQLCFAQCYSFCITVTAITFSRFYQCHYHSESFSRGSDIKIEIAIASRMLTRRIVLAVALLPVIGLTAILVRAL